MGFTTKAFREMQDAALRAALNGVYQTAFAPARTGAVQQQACFDGEAFDAAMRDPGFLKIVLFDGDDAMGFIAVTNDLDKAAVTYVNPARLRALYPAEAANGTLWYVAALAILPAAQGRDGSVDLAKDLLALLAPDGVLGIDFAADMQPQFADYCLYNFRRAIKALGWNVGAEFTPLGSQAYGALSFPRK